MGQTNPNPTTCRIMKAPHPPSPQKANSIRKSQKSWVGSTQFCLAPRLALWTPASLRPICVFVLSFRMRPCCPRLFVSDFQVTLFPPYLFFLPPSSPSNVPYISSVIRYCTNKLNHLRINLPNWLTPTLSSCPCFCPRQLSLESHILTSFVMYK